MQCLHTPPRRQVLDDPSVVSFVSANIAIAFSYADLAAAQYGTGDSQGGDQSRAEAEAAYQIAMRALVGERYVDRLADAKKREFNEELQRLRFKLDFVARRSVPVSFNRPAVGGRLSSGGGL